MKRTLKSNYAGNQITGPWQSKQHLEAIPKNLKRFAVFSVFFNKLAATIGNFVESQCNAGYICSNILVTGERLLAFLHNS
jgi:hypothetical protein